MVAQNRAGTGACPYVCIFDCGHYLATLLAILLILRIFSAFATPVLLIYDISRTNAGISNSYLASRFFRGSMVTPLVIMLNGVQRSEASSSRTRLLRIELSCARGIGNYLKTVNVILSVAKNLWVADLRNLLFGGEMVRFAHHDKSECSLEIVS